jgi:hypothetical protein
MSVYFNASQLDGDYKLRLSIAMDLTKQKKTEQVKRVMKHVFKTTFLKLMLFAALK